MKFILASKSPRRREILENIGLDFEIVTSDAPENYEPSLSPSQIVTALAARKAEAVRDKLRAEGRELSDTVIIASDTVVVSDGEILGKPRDRMDARRMVKLICGREHSVLSGISVICEGKLVSSHEETFVRFGRMTDAQIDWYVSSGECDDKAGAYAIQGYASIFIEGIRGDYFNVVGLPVARLSHMLSDSFGITLSDYLKLK
ncbi:MAG: Maf family protein [Eubacteriales bacterium]